LRHQRALALDPEDVGKNLGEDPEFPGEAGDLFETRRIRGTLIDWSMASFRAVSAVSAAWASSSFPVTT
jgi:hypothetical protein